MLHSATLAETEHSVTRLTHATSPALPSFGLRRWITAAVASVSLIAATAAPVQADRASDDLAKALVAALAVGALVHSLKKDRAEAAPPAPTPVHRRRHVEPVVPSSCAFEINGRHRNVTVFPERCLRREGFSYRLPRDCAFSARVFGRPDRVYSEQCLADAGFRIEGRGQDWGRDWGHDRDRWGHGFPRHDR